jgi:hypothetical protein
MSELLQPLRELFEWVDTFPSSIALRESQYVWSGVVVTHVISVCLAVGLLLVMDLRLLGAAHLQAPFSRLQRRLFPWQMAGVVLSIVTGLLLLYAQPLRYYRSVYFWMKMLTMALAALNAMAFHSRIYPSVAEWDERRRLPFGARAAGVLGMLFWAIVVIEGRLIPYSLTWFPQE